MKFNDLIQKICNQTSLNKDEARMLIEHISKKSWAQLMATDNPLNQKEQHQIDHVMQEIITTQKPLAYILKNVPFLDLTIHVEPPILIPRHETEEFVATIIDRLKQYEISKILDLATGSGCIALALAKHFPNAEVVGVDINPQAVQLARKNATENKIKNVTFIVSNLFASVANQKFDLIVSNPPYIDPSKKENISTSVLNWEDEQALFASENGLFIIKKIINQSKAFLNNNQNLPFQLVIEIDHDQADIVQTLATNALWQNEIHYDAFGKPRTLWCK